MTAKHVYEMLADCFVNEQTRHCFALLGDANMHWAAALQQRDCAFTFVRDEHCAVSAAMAWSRASGEIGVASVTCGPGLTQITTALPVAVRAGIPLVIFAGEAPLHKPWYNQAIDQAPFVTACGAQYRALHSVELMSRQVRDAFLYAREHQTPVVLGVPMDLQDQRAPVADLPTPSRELLGEREPAPPHPLDVARAAERIIGAQRIVVMAGLGAVRSGAGDACRALARQTAALLATTLPARGLFHDEPHCLGVVGGFASQFTRDTLARADLIIAVGCRLASHNHANLFDAATVLQIDLVPRSVSQGRQSSQSQLRGDARLAVEALLEQLPPARPETDDWRSDQTAALIASTPADSQPYPPEPGRHDPRDVVAALDRALPCDWHCVNSSGHCSWFFAQMRGRPVERFLTIREFGAIGNGLSYAIGVAVASGGAPVVLFDGDGSFLMHAQELETIRRHRLNILIVVMNDGAYGSEIHKLRASGLPDDGAVFGHCELADVARGFGLEGERIDDLADIDTALSRFSAQDGAALWDFHVSDKVVSPVLRR